MGDCPVGAYADHRARSRNETGPQITPHTLALAGWRSILLRSLSGCLLLCLIRLRRPGQGAIADHVVVGDGRLALARTNLNITYAELLARNGLATLTADAVYDPIEEAKGPKAVFSFAAVFAEVRVDPEFGLVRLNRFVGAYDAGRIINPKTARSQAIGGIIWGVGQALLEQSETDPVLGRFLNRNYSGYLVPTNADIPEFDVLFLGEFDAEGSPLGAKGLGELTAVSVAPAIANAVYHATGKRIRDLPITMEKLL
jgi:xanthine dehydrogenase YagR molybdenum-binding subunit